MIIIKGSAKTLYKVGIIVNIFFIVLTFIVFVGSIIVIALKDDIALRALEAKIESFDNPNEVRLAGVIGLIASIIYLLFNIAMLIFSIQADKKLSHGSKKSGPYVQLMIIGLFGNLFYFLSGLFGTFEQEKLPEDLE